MQQVHAMLREAGPSIQRSKVYRCNKTHPQTTRASLLRMNPPPPPPLSKTHTTKAGKVCRSGGLGYCFTALFPPHWSTTLFSSFVQASKLAALGPISGGPTIPGDLDLPDSCGGRVSAESGVYTILLLLHFLILLLLHFLNLQA